MRSKSIAVTAIVFAIAGSLIAPSPAVASSEDASEDSDKTINVVQPITHSLTLEEAIAAAAASGRNIVGFGFENDGVVGEYYPRGEDPDEFASQFLRDFGMQPRIVAFVELVEVRDGDLSPATRETIEVPPSNAASRLSQRSRDGAMWDALAEGRAAASRQGIPSESGESGLTESAVAGQNPSARVTLSWEPSFARFALRNVGSNPQKASIFQEFIWSEPGYHPVFRDLDTALEFEINQHNANPLHWSTIRPNCVWNIREHFWATNSGYTWGVASPFGFDPAGVGAYADTNDLSDPCARQAMAIGLANPGNVLDNGYGLTQLAIWITANRGNVATDSHVSGGIQAVEKLSCNVWPWNGNVSTDCVGLDTLYAYDGYGPSAILTLNESRNVWAPEKCWQRSRVAQVWQPGAPADQLYFGSCNDMFGSPN